MVLQGRTLTQLEEHVGFNLAPDRFVSSTTSKASCDATSWFDNTLIGGSSDWDDEYNGRWLLVTSGCNIGAVRRVTDYCGTCYDLTVAPALCNNPACGDSYLLFPSDIHPNLVRNAIRQAIIDATGVAYDPEESQAIHLHPCCLRYCIPSQFAMLSRIDFRNWHCSKIVDQADCTWTTNHCCTNVNQVSCCDIKREGNASLRVQLTAGFTTGPAVTNNICALDLQEYDTLELWVRSTVALTAGQARIQLRECCCTKECLQVPATCADTWTYHRISLCCPHLDCNINRVRLHMQCDIGASYIWLDAINVVKKDSARWVTIHRNDWRIDRQAGDIVFDARPRYGLIKLVGGDNPLVLTSQGDVNEIDDSYVIEAATASIKLSQTTLTVGERQLWQARAENARTGLHRPWGIREVT